MKTTTPIMTPPFENLRVRNLRQLNILDTGSDPYFDDLLKEAVEIMETPMGALSFVDQNRQWFKARIGIDFAETPRDVSFCTYTIMHPSRPLIIPDATKLSVLKNNPLVTSGTILSYAGVPINSPDLGLTIGSFCVFDSKPRKFTDVQIRKLQILAGSVQMELTRNMLLEEHSKLLLTAPLKWG